VAIRCGISNSSAIGSVTKRLVAVMMTSVSPLQVHERTGGGRDHGQNLGLHVLPVPAIEGGAVVTRERAQRECEKFHDVERAGLVLGVIALVFTLVFLAVHDVVLDEKTAPGMVAVAAQQRVVEVEDREGQGQES
jgi:hypothetical protein